MRKMLVDVVLGNIEAEGASTLDETDMNIS